MASLRSQCVGLLQASQQFGNDNTLQPFKSKPYRENEKVDRRGPASVYKLACLGCCPVDDGRANDTANNHSLTTI